MLAALLPEWAVLPNCILILVVFLAFRDPSAKGAILAFILGLMLDFSSGILVGPLAGSMVVVYGTLVVFSQRLFVDSTVAGMVTVFVSSIIGQVVYLIMVFEFRPANTSAISLALIEAGVTALFSPLILAIAKFLFLRREGRSSNRFASIGM